MIYKIYLAGAIGCFGKERFNEGNNWRVHIKRELESADSIYRVICDNPNDYYNFLNKEHKSELEIQKFDLDKVRQANLIIVNFNAYSIGTSKELAVANEYRKHVIGLNENGLELHSWDVNDCIRIFDNMHEMLDHVKKFYLN